MLPILDSFQSVITHGILIYTLDNQNLLESSEHKHDAFKIYCIEINIFYFHNLLKEERTYRIKYFHIWRYE